MFENCKEKKFKRTEIIQRVVDSRKGRVVIIENVPPEMRKNTSISLINLVIRVVYLRAEGKELG